MRASDVGGNQRFVIDEQVIDVDIWAGLPEPGEDLVVKKAEPVQVNIRNVVGLEGMGDMMSIEGRSMSVSSGKRIAPLSSPKRAKCKSRGWGRVYLNSHLVRIDRK